MAENIITSFDIDYLETDFEQLLKQLKKRMVVVKKTLEDLKQEEQKLNAWIEFIEKRLEKPATDEIDPNHPIFRTECYFDSKGRD